MNLELSLTASFNVCSPGQFQPNMRLGHMHRPNSSQSLYIRYHYLSTGLMENLLLTHTSSQMFDVEFESPQKSASLMLVSPYRELSVSLLKTAWKNTLMRMLAMAPKHSAYDHRSS